MQVTIRKQKIKKKKDRPKKKAMETTGAKAGAIKAAKATKAAKPAKPAMKAMKAAKAMTAMKKVEGEEGEDNNVVSLVIRQPQRVPTKPRSSMLVAR